jgi:hypothetical protein
LAAPIREKGIVVIINAKDIIMEIRTINVMAGMGNITVIGITTGVTNKISSIAYIGLGSNVVKNTKMI